MDEETLNRLAAEALLQEAKIGARRAAIIGPSGWIRKRETINKQFLHATLKNVISSNRHKTFSNKSKQNNTSSKSLENNDKH
ncbi:PREDICTED: uncharacterized protein LOC105360165 [Ceratosolen solmsi marchali]|uniref:Uncharacterized protein LOC105360165 n=1 Tax=Ceratosolen solmsi marchali TaxID=326594 RepID=A0AAJ6VL73_9HYME|nr:PREDICTED: uncharacterized protein LOC105360165 [Ceratosolen solmsi marchali]